MTHGLPWMDVGSPIFRNHLRGIGLIHVTYENSFLGRSLDIPEYGLWFAYLNLSVWTDPGSEPWPI